MSVYHIPDQDNFHRPARSSWIGDLEVLERMQFRGWQHLSLDGTDADPLRQDI